MTGVLGGDRDAVHGDDVAGRVGRRSGLGRHGERRSREADRREEECAQTGAANESHEQPFRLGPT